MVAALAAAITAGSAMSASAAWVESGSDWKYQNTDGSWQTNTWFQDGGKSYHFDANGNVQKGWFKDANGKWFFFSYNGVMQTGLIKVDEKVYFMNDDGSLFVGNKEINKVEYNFTENGTTNGKPSVGLSQTWGGNGNQSGVVKGGGGWSSSGGSSSGGSNSGNTNTSGNTSTPEKKVVNQVVVAAVGEVKNEYLSASINESTGTITLVPTKKDDEVQTLAEVYGEAANILADVLAEDVASVKWNGESIESEEDLKKIAKSQGYDRNSLLTDVDNKYSIVITLDNGDVLKYTVSVK